MPLDWSEPYPVPCEPPWEMPREEPHQLEPPTADHVERVGHLLAIPYLVGLLGLDYTGARVGELESARIGDLDEDRKA